MKFVYALIAVFATATAFADDWTQIGNVFTKHRDDGSTWTYTSYYSPSSVVRNGDLVTASFQSINTAASADANETRRYVVELNCATKQYRWKHADGEFGNLNDVKPNTLGSDAVGILCR